MYYKIIVAYDGLDYFGWQEQKKENTVCGTLKKCFKSAFKTNLTIVGASRTDAGVHANGQVARINTELNLEPNKIKEVFNRSLPDDILIKELTKCNENFHPQKNVLEKTYIYKVFINQKPSPFVQRYGYFYDFDIDLKKLQNCLKIFVGKHDFRSFCTGYDMKSTIKTINSINIKKINKNEFDIIFKGESFLRYMIRRIVGASLEIASKTHLNIDKLKKALEEKNPHQNLWTADPKGLTLFDIQYKE